MRTLLPWTAGFVSLTLWVGCDSLVRMKPDTQVNPEWQLCRDHPEHERCVDRVAAHCEKHPDDFDWCPVEGAATRDAKVDAGTDAQTDADGPDASCQCVEALPVCIDGRCVECSADQIAACDAETPYCNDTTNQCTQCLADEHCTDPTAAHCDPDTLTCQPCTQDAQCQGVMAGGVELSACDQGQCVQCTVATELTACGETSCDPARSRCTQTLRASLTTCEPCVADSECTQDHRCIELFFGEEAERESLGGWCMKRGATDCAFPYQGPPITRESLSGAPAEVYCGISEQRTSCQAITTLTGGTACPSGEDDECGAPGALCRRVNNGNNQCTYACEISAECPSAAACPTGGTDKYCGKT